MVFNIFWIPIKTSHPNDIIHNNFVVGKNIVVQGCQDKKKR
jgi:hypothetical protein